MRDEGKDAAAAAAATVPDEGLTEAQRKALDERVAKAVRQFRRDAAGLAPRSCPLCGFHGPFTAYGRPPRLDATCLKCGSLERHRLFKLLLDRQPLIGPEDRVLHFAPEPPLRRLLKGLTRRYETADLRASKRLTHQLNVEAIAMPDASVDRVVCNHVLEHVDDRKALAEFHRILVPGGLALLTTPVIEGWAETYENPAVRKQADRVVHFGQKDHLRYYGRDVRVRIRVAGFDLEEFVAVEPDVREHGLIRGETIFIARKPGQTA